MSLTFLLLSLFLFFNSYLCASSTYYLQVSHQAPTLYGKTLNFYVSGMLISDDIIYGNGSLFLDISSSVYSPYVWIYASTQDGSVVAGKNVTLKNGFQSFFVVSLPDGSTSSLFYSWPNHSPSGSTWFALFDLSPEQTDEVIYYVNGDALVTDVDYQKPSAVYTSNAGYYDFTVKNSTTTLASNYFVLQPGTIQSVIFNGINATTKYQVFKLNDWHSTSYSAQLRVVQAVPDSQAYVWIGGIESWQNVGYTTVSPYEIVGSGVETPIYVSLTPTKPSTPTCSYNFASYLSYSLLVLGSPENGVPLQAVVLTDQSMAPYYTRYSNRIAYLSPTGSAVEAYLNNVDIGRLTPLDPDSLASAQQPEYPSTSDTNVTLINSEINFLAEIDADTFDTGAAYTLFVMGIWGSEDSDLEVLVALDVEAEPITKLSDHAVEDDEDDDDGLSGGEIAGIVIGVLIGVALIAALVIYVRRRAAAVSTDADYEAVPSNHFL